MDVDLNTLQYLTEPHMLNKLTKKDKNTSLNNEINFYKKRIYATTKKLLLRTNANINDDIRSAFENYTKLLIQHYKITDTNDILQQEFKHLKEEQIKDNTPLDVDVESKANEFIINKPSQENNTLKSFVKTVSCKSKEQVVLPRQRVVNLKNKKLKNKV